MSRPTGTIPHPHGHASSVTAAYLSIPPMQASLSAHRHGTMKDIQGRLGRTSGQAYTRRRTCHRTTTPDNLTVSPSIRLTAAVPASPRANSSVLPRHVLRAVESPQFPIDRQRCSVGLIRRACSADRSGPIEISKEPEAQRPNMTHEGQAARRSLLSAEG